MREDARSREVPSSGPPGEPSGASAKLLAAEAEARAVAEAQRWGEEALELNARVLELDPANSAAAVRLGRCLAALGRLERALEVFDAVLRREPTHPVAAARRERVKRKLEARERVRALDAQGQGALLSAAEEAKQAERDYVFQAEARRHLAEREGTPPAFSALGAVLRHTREREEALEAYRRAMELDPAKETNSMAFVGLAGVLRDAGRLEDARAILDGVLELRPRDTFALRGLFGVLLDLATKRGRRELLPEAGRCLRRAQASGVEPKELSAAWGALRRAEGSA